MKTFSATFFMTVLIAGVSFVKTMLTSPRVFALLALQLFTGGLLPAQPLPPKALHLAPLPALEGDLFIYGANSMLYEVVHLAEGFEKLYPKVSVKIESLSVSSSLFADGPREGSNHLFMYDHLSPTDRLRLSSLAGPRPVEVDLFGRALYVLVSHRNPIERISLADLKSLYFHRDAAPLKWNALGVPGTHPLSGRPVIPHYGSGDISGNTRLFRRTIIAAEPLGNTGRVGNSENIGKNVVRSRGFDALIKSITGEENTIAVSQGLSVDFKVLAVEAGENGEAVKPPSLLDGQGSDLQYPLLRISKLYSPIAGENRLHREFLKYALSPEGQKIIAGQSFTIPLTEKARLRELSKLVE